MALGKINISGSRITNGKWQILADGGWVQASMLNSDKLSAALRFVDAMPAEYQTRHASNTAYTYDPRHVGSDNEYQGPRNKDKGGQKPEQGDGESDYAETESDGSEGDQDGQGGGGGDGDDQPVWHSEFDPWQEKADKAIEEVEQHTSQIATVLGNIGTLADRAARLERENKRISAEVTQLKVHGGGGGNGGGVIVRVEVRQGFDGDYKGHDGVFHNQFDKLLKNISGGHHCYLPGPPGSGKSHAAKQAADVLGWRFGALSLGPTTPESRLWGGRDANNNFFEPPLVKLARYAMENTDQGAVYCLDELDNGHPGIIATLNSGMANGWFEAPNGDLIEWGDNFVIVGSANTYGTGPTAEFSGRNRLDSATLDRFNFLPWDTDTAMESAMVHAILEGQDTLIADWLDVWHSARRNVVTHGLKVFITMRGAIRGAKMLAQGRDIYDVAGEVLLNKLPDDQKVKISPF